MSKKINNIICPNAVSVGVTWFDSKLLYGPESKALRQWIGICHYSERVWMFSPFDYRKPTMITGFDVSPIEARCDQEEECVYFKCHLNKFKLESFINQFEDVGAYSLGLPRDFGTKDLWYNEEEWGRFWGRVVSVFNMRPEGGTLEWSEEMWAVRNDYLYK